MNKNNKSGFFDLEGINNCTHPSHNPPMHIVIPNGKGYRHVCPQCGKETILTGTNITF